jgi:hypothetical protein
VRRLPRRIKKHVKNVLRIRNEIEKYAEGVSVSPGILKSVYAGVKANASDGWWMRRPWYLHRWYLIVAAQGFGYTIQHRLSRNQLLRLIKASEWKGPADA